MFSAQSVIPCVLMASDLQCDNVDFQEKFGLKNHARNIQAVGEHN